MKKHTFAIGAVLFWCVLTVSGAAWCGDNGDGTVTITGGLVALKDAGCLGKMRWNDAMARAKTVADGQCGLTDKSKPGDWRLPTLAEFELLYPYRTKFKNLQVGPYWSSSTYVGDTNHAWIVWVFSGAWAHDNKLGVKNVWAVRGGQ